MLNEKIIDTIIIDGVEFTIIEKAKTFYAGFYAAANASDNLDAEPDIDSIYQNYENNKHKIISSIMPECRICFSIDYTTQERPCAIFFGEETNSPNQPEGIHVIATEPTILIKVKSTNAAWVLTKKLTGYNPICNSPLFFLIWHIFCEGSNCKYERIGDITKGSHEAEYYYADGEQYVTVPVKLKDAIPEQWNS